MSNLNQKILEWHIIMSRIELDRRSFILNGSMRAKGHSPILELKSIAILKTYTANLLYRRITGSSPVNVALGILAELVYAID